MALSYTQRVRRTRGVQRRSPEDAGYWNVIVEQQNRIIHDHREPFWVDWNFSKFLRSYRQRPIYLITANPPGALDTPFPEFLRCDLIQRHTEDTRLWMSAGNTSSSLHFDTHDVVIQQIDGVKEIFLWHPDIGNATYQDHHTRYGLSPINVDRVDKIRFPEFARHRPYFVVLYPGDVLYLPTLWHQFRAPPGRDIMKTYEIDYRLNIPPMLSATKTEAHLHAWKHTLARTPNRCDALRRRSDIKEPDTPRIHIPLASQISEDSSSCRSFCTSPCSDLNGDYKSECKYCGEDYACNPSVWQC